jgi:hypothetical protein
MKLEEIKLVEAESIENVYYPMLNNILIISDNYLEI